MLEASRSARAARTRSALLEAGLELVAERPVDAIAIDEIVATAGVAKGSFFNHFTDKPGFAAALADDIRREIEARVARANTGVQDPLERLVGGMAAAAAFSLGDPKRVVVLTRTADGMVLQTHPLNAGVSRDVEASAASGMISPQGARRGVLFWLGCCQALMSAIVAEHASARRAAGLLRDMAWLGLTGLGVAPDRIERLMEALRLSRLGD